MTQPWDAARSASRRPLRRPYKPVAAVGKRLESNGAPGSTTLMRKWFGPHGEQLTTCSGCGYHVCSCDTADSSTYELVSLPVGGLGWRRKVTVTP